MAKVYFYSGAFLEKWDWRTPWASGVGGSEVSAIEMAQRLQKLGHDVTNYVPLPDDTPDGTIHAGVTYRDVKHAQADLALTPGIIINYRDPKFFSWDKLPSQSWWFVSQDVGYEFPESFFSGIDRYICLCKEHVRYTLQVCQPLRGKVFQSSNGVRVDWLQEYEADHSYKLPERHPHRLLYASSPDRGLKVLLENWFRIREQFPNAELRVAYGFNNMEIVAKMSGGTSWHVGYQRELEALLEQPGITHLGRLPQDKLYEEWYAAGVWAYPTTFPETSCITAMDAQALGCTPVTTNFWAVGENVQHGYMVDGSPERSEIVRSLWLENLYAAMASPMSHVDRLEMMQWARRNFDWNRFAKQWDDWIEKDDRTITHTAALTAVTAPVKASRKRSSNGRVRSKRRAPLAK